MCGYQRPPEISEQGAEPAWVPGRDLPASSDLHLLQTVDCCIFILHSQETLSTSLRLFRLQMNMRFAGEQRRERVVREAVSMFKTSCLRCEIPFDPHLWRVVLLPHYLPESQAPASFFISNHLHSFFQYLFYVYVPIFITHACKSLKRSAEGEVSRGRGQKRSVPLELESQMVVNHHVGARNWILYGSSKCF